MKIIVPEQYREEISTILICQQDGPILVYQTFLSKILFAVGDLPLSYLQKILEWSGCSRTAQLPFVFPSVDGR